MPEYPVDWVDAFTDRPFGGNGCAVVHGAADLSDDPCINFTRENSLVECTFLGPSDVADVKVRYFLASGEIPFAGHPTLATAASLHHRGLAGLGRINFETGAGVVPIDLSMSDGALSVRMEQIAPTFGERVPEALVARVMGLHVDDILAPPQMVSTGIAFCITPVRDLQSLRDARLDVGALEEMAQVTGARGIDMMEPYLVTPQGATAAGDTFGRLLLAPPSSPEDPFTSSATGAAAAYLYEYKLIGKRRWVAEQGHFMGRPGRGEVEVLGPKQALTGVALSGRAHVLMSGTLRL